MYPASEARRLLNPLRYLMHPPRRLVRRLELAVDAHVLEVGPGPGWFSRSLAAAVPQGRLHLLDLQAQMLELADEAGLRLLRRHGRILGCTAILTR